MEMYPLGLPHTHTHTKCFSSFHMSPFKRKTVRQIPMVLAPQEAEAEEEARVPAQPRQHSRIPDFFIFWFGLELFFLERVSLVSIDQAGLKIRDLPASATMACLQILYL